MSFLTVLTAWACLAALPGCSHEADGRPSMVMAGDTKGEGRALVLVGGGLTGWQSWVPHQERLAAQRRVSRLQPLNVQLGLDATPLPADYSVELESRALDASLDRATFHDAVDIVAWSYGALVTLDFALDHPSACGRSR